MNWIKIDENWKFFVKNYTLKDDSGEKNYFYGKQELYKATEYFKGFVIYYENKFNKSTEMGSSFRIGHRLTMVSPIDVAKRESMKIEKSSFWKTIFKPNRKLNIELSDTEIVKHLPLEEIEILTSFFPDLKLSIKKFGKYQNQEVSYGQTVLILETKYQPKEFEHLKKSREVIISILQKLSESKKIKPTYNKT